MEGNLICFRPASSAAFQSNGRATPGGRGNAILIGNSYEILH